MQLWVTIKGVVRRRVGGQTEIFACPCTHVDVFAALAAKWTKRVAKRINTGTATAGARYLPHRGRIFFHKEKNIRVKMKVAMRI